MSGKEPRSFSIDADLKRLLSEREELNASAAVNEFLREYVSSGRGEEAALEVRLQQLNEEIGDLRRKLDEKDQERERIQAALDNRRSTLQEQLDKAEKAVRQSPGLAAQLGEDHDLVEHRAGKAGVQPSQFLTKLEARL